MSVPSSTSRAARFVPVALALVHAGCAIDSRLVYVEETAATDGATDSKSDRGPDATGKGGSTSTGAGGSGLGGNYGTGGQSGLGGKFGAGGFGTGGIFTGMGGFFAGMGGTFGAGGGPRDAGFDRPNDSGGLGAVTQIACPSLPPAGACSFEAQVCLYFDQNQTCGCHNGSWTCIACPAVAPASGASCAISPDGGSAVDPNDPEERLLLSLYCRYGSLECTCGGPNAAWVCGICPAGEPTAGQPCGNVPFTCNYGADACSCSATWSCGPVAGACPAAGSGLVSCSPLGPAVCQYSALDQTCACGPLSAYSSYFSCSCPATAPVPGASCPYSYPPTECGYAADQTCTCTSGRWSCTTSCPATQPLNHSPCSSQLNCQYGDGGTQLCACDGSSWTCAGGA